MVSRIRRARGFSSIMLIAIIVLVASLCAYSLRFLGAARGTASVDLMTERMRQAARAGIEWQRMQVSLAVPVCNPATNIVVPFSSGNFPVRVTCTQTASPTSTTDKDSASADYHVGAYTVSAMACWPAPAGCPNAAPPADYVERTVNATVTVNSP